MFTGDSKIQDILHVVENGIFLQYGAHGAFSGTLGGELKRRRRMGIAVISLNNAFRGVYFQCPGVGTGTELHFSIESGHNPPNPNVFALHLYLNWKPAPTVEHANVKLRS